MEKFSSSKIPLWINFHGIPMELFTNEAISRIASVVDIPLLMDRATKLCNRLSFARVCVEISQEASLPASIHVDIEYFGNIEVVVKYPWRPLFCSLCKESSHHDIDCKSFK